MAGKLQEQWWWFVSNFGAIFHLALLFLKLEIIERHQHSVDIYTEENRYTPLGTDASVFLGTKICALEILIIFPIQFWFSVEENHFIELCSKEK